MKNIKLSNFEISNKSNFILIAGPCVIENENHSLMMTEQIAKICQKLKIHFIFKSSFDKANRSSINSNRGIDINQAEKLSKYIINQRIKKKISTNFEFIDILRNSGVNFRSKKIHFATQAFQALRIKSNSELHNLEIFQKKQRFQFLFGMSGCQQ